MTHNRAMRRAAASKGSKKLKYTMNDLTYKDMETKKQRLFKNKKLDL